MDMNLWRKPFFGKKLIEAQDSESMSAVARKAMAESDRAFLHIFHEQCLMLLIKDETVLSTPPAGPGAVAAGSGESKLARMKTRGRT